MKATIKLFNAIPVKDKRKKKASKALLEKTIPRGFVFAPEVVQEYSNYDELIKMVEEEIGLTPENLNATFHKSWKKIKEASIEQLVIEQLIHYFTTYGFEQLGIYDEASVYIPQEDLEIPELDVDKVKLTIIKGYTHEELKVKLLNLLKSGIALGEETIQAVVEVALLVGISPQEVDDIKNKEVKCKLCNILNLIPKNPTEFLRYLIYEVTDSTLLIKNKTTIKAIQESNKALRIIKLLRDYEKEYGLEKLAEIFYRFKPLFLAFRGTRLINRVVNKIRRLAVKNHKPMQEDFLNSITSLIKNGKKITKVKLVSELKKVNTFRKVRLAYALKFRTTEADSIVYRLRNGKAHVETFHFENKKEAERILKLVLESISEDLSKNVKGKKVYIPETMRYTLPATEKQFTGNLPTGSCITVPKDMIVGIHWENYKKHRTDLDLSMINIDGKLGWDSSYRNADRSILFSGDIVTAPKPKGATELFYVKRKKETESILIVNNYTYGDFTEEEIPFKILVAQEEAKNFKQNYMVNPNNIKSVVKTVIGERQKILGLLCTTTKDCKFYYVETNIGGNISSSCSEQTTLTKDYLLNYYKNTISLNKVLVKAGAKMVDKAEDADIDLTPENLEKDTIINLITNVAKGL